MFTHFLNVAESDTSNAMELYMRGRNPKCLLALDIFDSATDSRGIAACDAKIDLTVEVCTHCYLHLHAHLRMALLFRRTSLLRHANDFVLLDTSSGRVFYCFHLFAC